MKTYKYIALAAIALGFAACSQEEDFTPQGNQKGAPITIASVGVANLATRATIEDDKLVEGNIGVTITSTGNDERYTGSNVNWYGSNGVWGLVENQKVVLYEGNGESQKIYAYYPYAKDIIEGTENLPVTLPETFDSNFEGYDYLCTKEGISLSQNPISLTLSHAFSKVSVSVNVMGNELEGDVVTEIALANVPRNGERSATTGAIDPDKYGPANGRIALYGYDDEDYDEVADYYIGYALPNAATTLDLRVTMQSGRIFTAKAPISGGMTDGVHYKIGLNLGKDKAEVGTVTVAPWGTGGTIEGSVAEEVIPNTFDATAMTAEQLNATVAKALDYGHTELAITLAADADATMFSAITSALAADGIEEGSIDLTISGAKTVPEYGFFDQGNYFANGEKNIAGEKLKSLTLTDVETIGKYAFSACTNLEDVNMPKVVTIGDCAFNEYTKGTKLTSLDLPNATTIGENAFAYSSLLTSVNLPKMVTIGLQAFCNCDIRTLDLPEVTEIGTGAFEGNDNLVSCSASKATTIGAYPWGNCSKLETLELTAAGDFTLYNNLFAYTPTEQINLVLNEDKASQVTQNDDGTATWKTTNRNGGILEYTFKSITTQE